MMRAHFTIYSHYEKMPTVIVGAHDGSAWVDIRDDSSGVMLTLHCNGLSQAEQAAEKLRAALALARGEDARPQAAVEVPAQATMDDPLDVEF